MVTLARRFSAAFVLIVALPSLVVSVALARLYLSALEDTVAVQSAATAEQMALAIRGEADGVSILAAALLHDGELRGLARTYAGARTRTARYLAARRLDEKLVSFFTYSNRMGAVVLYLKGGGAYAYSNYPNIRAIGALDRTVYAAAAADPGRVVLLDTLEGVAGNIDQKNMITIAVCPAPGEETALEAIVVMFRVPYFDALVAQAGAEAASDVVIFGRSGRPILSSLPGGAIGGELAALARPAVVTPGAPGAPGAGPPSVRSIRSGGRSWLATLRPMDSTGWTVVLLADKAALSRRVTRYQWYLYPALGLLALLFVAYAELFFARIAVPIRAVTRHMRRVGEGDYAVRAAPPSIAELNHLSQGFNSMVEEIERLQAERQRMERERLAAELDALRYQINPHFVANTLNSIRLLASAMHADAIATMTRDLMRVLSDSYAGDKLAELSRELDNVTAYVGIMKVRFGEVLAVEVDAAPGTESLLTLRTILQPIVENAILHGFSGGSSGAARAGRGTIRVTARLEARALPAPTVPEPWAEALPGRALVVEVRDDGAGIDPARAADILAGTASAGRGSLHRIGIANVHRRIRLNFGEAYGLEIDGEPGAFTRVRFVLPALVRAAEAGAAPEVARA